MRRPTRLAATLTLFALTLGLTGCIVIEDSNSSSNREVVTASSSNSIRIVNNSNWDVMEIYVSPADENAWGSDLLDIELLEPGDSVTVEVDFGVWDIRCVDDAEMAHEYYDVVFDGDHLEWVLD